MNRKSAIICLCVALGIAAWAQAPEGIPRELARQRAAEISDVRYQLNFALVPKASTISGNLLLHFVLKNGGESEWLDFRGEAVRNLKINGTTADTAIQNGHLELPAKLLKAGQNVVEIDFTAPVAPAGKAFTRFEDKDDGSEYIYTLFVPMDAEMAFPCFDQPDLKARLQLTVTLPADWVVISNTKSNEAGSIARVHGGVVSRPEMHQLQFAETQPIPTYLFAFAAGPFVKVHDTPGLPGLYVRKSKAQKAEAEAPEVQQIAADGIKFLSDYFAQPFPFPKYDLILIPGFAYGGMEHAGATFLREESVLFRTAPTHTDHINRDLLVLHETTHQWFGDLVTMRWFDDLWLKEGFAQYMAYYALNALKPDENVWKRFYQAIKPGAYNIDSTQGTTPIYQDIANLKDAKSAYGAIVYSKAPGVIKQLAFVVGDNNFRDGLRLYLKEHAYANAEWSDLVGALEQTSKKPLQAWADAWIKRRGMPQVDVEWSCDAKKQIDHFVIRQHDVLKEGGPWPIATQVLLNFGFKGTDTTLEGAPGHIVARYGARARTLRTEFSGKETEVADAIGQPCPRFVFANDGDFAYGRFLLDPVSRKAAEEDLDRIADIFTRTLLWGSLWDSVREAEMDPREYIELALRELPNEQDESLAQSIIGRTTYALHRYVSAETRAQLGPKMEALAGSQMVHSQSQDMRIAWFRALRGVAETAPARQQLKDMLSGKLVVPGVELRPLDRWNLVATLVALNDPEADAVLAAEEKRDPSGDGKKYAYMASAARPTAETKKKYFDDYLHDPSRPEDWVEQSLGAFNWWNQSELTAPYLKPALDALPQVKQQRKIFFLLGWLNAFVGGQQSPEAQREVYSYLKSGAIDRDLKLKILEVVDELDRTVKIRAKYK